MSDWEGGLRVAALVSGGVLPDKIRGTELKDYFHIADWYATFAAVAGVDVNDDVAAQFNLPAVDSVNQWPLLSGQLQPGSNLRKDIHISKETLIEGRWKLMTGKVPFAAWTPGYGFAPWITLFRRQDCKDGCLFDIENDPTEKKDVAAQHPDIVAKMRSRLDTLNQGFFDPSRGEFDAKSLQACKTLQRGGYYTAFADDVDASSAALLV